VSRSVELTFPAHARYLVLARLSVAGIAPVARLDAEQLADLKLAVTEACANVVRHAYPDDTRGEVRLRIVVEETGLVIEVADDGRGMDADGIAGWDPAQLREQGMGLAIVRSVMDDVEIESPPGGGTVVRLHKSLQAAQR